jgi:hypothetical protein
VLEERLLHGGLVAGSQPLHATERLQLLEHVRRAPGLLLGLLDRSVVDDALGILEPLHVPADRLFRGGFVV